MIKRKNHGDAKDHFFGLYNLKDSNYLSINAERISLRITILYVLIGGFWILLSDGILTRLIKHAERVYLIQVFKGWFYVLVTALVLYTLVHKSLSKIRRSAEEVQNSYRRLSETYQNLVEAKEKLAKSEERYDLAVFASNDGIWDIDISKNALYVSPRGLEILGNPKTTGILNEDFYANMLHPDDKAKTMARIADYLAHRLENYEDVFQIRTPEGGCRWVHTRGKAIWDEQGHPLRMVGTSSDITQRKEMEERIYRLAYFDDLTGLPNKHFLKEKIDSMLSNGETKPFALLCIGLDNFKKINNIMGYEYGDELLKSLAESLGGFQNRAETLCRFGGDEFVLITSDVADPGELLDLANNVLREIELSTAARAGQIGLLTGSIGIALCPRDGRDYNALLSNADTAMHDIKERGGRAAEFFNESFSLRRTEAATLENDLRRAVVRQEFTLRYQPKVRLKDKKIVGAEALIRWNHPGKGLLPPSAFISIAERNGLIIEIGYWVFLEVFRQSKRWQDKGFRPLPVSVNLSPVEFRQPGFAEKLKAVLEHINPSAVNVEFEITEGTLLSDLSGSAELFKKIRAQNIKILLDDFGTGYSSLSYLRELPIDYLKLDKSFIRDMNNPKDREIIAAVVGLAHKLGIEVVAEGVEKQEEAVLLEQMGCDIAQGYLFYHPLPADEFEKLLV